EIADEVRDLEERREPARIAIEAREQACVGAARARDEAAAVLAEASEAFTRAQHQIDALEADVDAARTQVYTILNSLITLRHALDHASLQRSKVGGALAKLDVEESDVFVELQKVDVERTAVGEALRRALEALSLVRTQQTAQDAALGVARSEHEVTL